MHRVTLIPGDGIGPEVAAAAQRILAATGLGIEWEEAAAPVVADHREENYLHWSTWPSFSVWRQCLWACPGCDCSKAS